MKSFDTFGVMIDMSRNAVIFIGAELIFVSAS